MKKFDEAYFEDGVLVLYKRQPEEAGFFVKIMNGCMELWSIPQYGGYERLEKQWNYICPEEAYNIAEGWT